MNGSDSRSDASCRTPTRAVDAQLTIGGGRREAVTLYLSTLSQTHDGPEMMEETLNRPRAFVPVRSRETEQTFLVRRSAIRMVEVGSDDPDVTRSEASPSFVDLVRIQLDGGEEVEGTLTTILPPDKARLSDFFNTTDTLFIALAVEDGVIYVNRDYISIVWL